MVIGKPADDVAGGLLRRAAALLVLALLAVLVPASPPAFAAISRVGVVSFVGASTTSLTLSWPKVSGATSYEVFLSRSQGHVRTATKVETPTGPSATVTGMNPGQTYCFQVRAKAGSSVGMRSAHTCKPTIREQAPISGQSYAVMTLNACSEVCSGWSGRHSAARTLISSRQPDVIAAQEAGAGPRRRRATRRLQQERQAPVLQDLSVHPGLDLEWPSCRVPHPEHAGSTPSGPSWGPGDVQADHLRQRPHLVGLRRLPARARELETLISTGAPAQHRRSAVVYAGDFNSHKNRGTYSESAGFGAQDTVGRTFAGCGLLRQLRPRPDPEAPELEQLQRLEDQAQAERGWGDDVDHVYIEPSGATSTGG